jgi:hypothetical protein
MAFYGEQAEASMDKLVENMNTEAAAQAVVPDTPVATVPIIENAATPAVVEKPFIAETPAAQTPVAVVENTPAAVATPVAEAPPINFNEVPDVLKTPEQRHNEVQVDEQYQEMLKYLEDPQVRALIEARRNNESMFDLSDKIRGNDPAKLSDAQLLEMKLDTFGLSEEEKEIERDSFASLSPLSKKEFIRPVKEQLIQEQKSRLELFANAAQEKNQQTQAVVQRATQRAISDLDNISASLTGQKVYGLEITPERLEKLKDYVLENTSVLNDGTLNVTLQQNFQNGIKQLFTEDIIKAQVAQTASDTTVKVLKENLRPSMNSTESPAVTVTEEEELSRVFNNISEEQKNKYNLNFK